MLRRYFGELNRDLFLTAFSLLIWGLGEGMFLIFQPIYLQQWGADPALIGVILGINGIAMTVVQTPTGFLVDKLGARPLMRASWILGVIGISIMAFAGTMWMFIVGFLVYGLTSFVLSPLNTYVTTVRGSWSIGRALTFTQAFYNIGAIIGPLIGGFIAPISGLAAVYKFALIVVVFSTIVIFIPRYHLPETHAHDPVHVNLFRNTRFVALLCISFLTLFATYLPQPLTPNYLQNVHHVDLGAIGRLGSIGSLGNAILALVLGNFPVPISFIAGQVMVGLYSFLIWQGTGITWFAIGYFFIGGYRICRTLVVAMARPLVSSRQVGLAFGLIETVNSAGFILAPFLAGFLYEHNPQSIYILSMVLISAVVIVNTIFSLMNRKPNAVLESNTFSDVFVNSEIMSHESEADLKTEIINPP